MHPTRLDCARHRGQRAQGLIALNDIALEWFPVLMTWVLAARRATKSPATTWPRVVQVLRSTFSSRRISSECPEKFDLLAQVRLFTPATSDTWLRMMLRALGFRPRAGGLSLARKAICRLHNRLASGWVACEEVVRLLVKWMFSTSRCSVLLKRLNWLLNCATFQAQP